MISCKTPLLGLLAALLLGCTPDGSSSSDDSTFLSSSSQDVREPAHASGEPDLGEDWVLDASPRSGDRTTSTGRATEGPYWSILLATFSEAGHQRAARTFINSAADFHARLRRAHVVSDEKGSRVLYGEYGSIDEKAAQRDLSWIKSISSRNRPVFPSSMLVRIKQETTTTAPLRSIDLMSLRRQYPNVDSLSTLQVAVWGDFGKAGRMRWEEIRRRSEAYARELRSRRFEAFVHHDEDKRMSIVTVGVFDHTAYDVQSGFESGELAALRKKFPVHLVNGEPMLELESRVTRETRPQPPRLVAVPKE